MTREQTRALADKVTNILKPYIERGHVCGSYRRGKPECGDLDLVVIPKRELVRDMFGMVIGDKPVDGFIQAVNSLGAKSKGDPATGKYFQRIVDGHKVEISTANKDNWGIMKMIRTGSYEFNILIMQHIRKIGLEQRDGYLWKNGKIMPVHEEEDYFRILSLPFVQPTLRDENAFRRITK